MEQMTGTFPGHAIPGTVFMVWGLWWFIGTLRFHRQQPGPWEPRSYISLIEVYAKAGLPAIAVVYELWWASWVLTDSSIINYQHATMYLCFSLAGLTDLQVARKHLPWYAGHVALAVAFLVVTLLFAGHSNAPGLAQAVHKLLVWVNLAIIAVLILEVRYRHVSFSIMRAFLMLLLGTWLWNIAYLLYASDLDPFAHPGVMLTHLFFVWHVLILAVVLFKVYRWTANHRNT